MLGIVIANWNGEKLIDKCLKSLSEQTFKNFKIYIIDNASNDDSIKIIDSYKKFMKINLIKLDYNSGFAVANNIGIKMAINDGVEYILTLNNDVEVQENCLEIAMNEIKNKYTSSDVFQLFMINYFDRNKCDAAGLIFDKKLFVTQVGYKEEVNKILEKDIRIEGSCAGAAIYSVKALEKVKLDERNYFDGNFFAYYEDVDLALRLKRAGFKSQLIKNAIVYHMHSATSNKTSGFKEYYLARNLLIYTKRNQPLEDFNKVKKSYYKLLIRVVMKNMLNIFVVKFIVKGIKDGTEEMKRTNFIQY